MGLIKDLKINIKYRNITEIGSTETSQEKDPGFAALKGHCTFNGLVVPASTARHPPAADAAS